MLLQNHFNCANWRIFCENLWFPNRIVLLQHHTKSNQIKFVQLVAVTKMCLYQERCRDNFLYKNDLKRSTQQQLLLYQVVQLVARLVYAGKDNLSPSHVAATLHVTWCVLTFTSVKWIHFLFFRYKRLIIGRFYAADLMHETTFLMQEKNNKTMLHVFIHQDTVQQVTRASWCILYHLRFT